MQRVAKGLLVLFVFAIPWEYSLDLGVPFGNIARVLGLATVLAAVSAVLQDLRFRKLKALHWLTATLYLWCCFSFFWTTTPDATLIHLRWYAQEMMLVWLVWQFSDTAEDLFRLMEAWLAGSWVLAALSLAAFASAMQDGQVRFVASGQDPNDVARYLDFGFPVAALVLNRGPKWIARILAISYFPLGFGCVMLTGSRSGLVTAMVALGGCGLLAIVRHPRRAVSGAIALSLAAALIVAAIPRETKGRLSSVSEIWERGDLNQRVNIWSAAWRAFEDAPIVGQGAGSFVRAAALAPEDTAHNTPLAVAVEGGLVALLLASGILGVSFHSVFRSRGSLRIGLIVLMCVWVISSLVGSIGENRMTWLLFGIAAVSERVGRDGQIELSEESDDDSWQWSGEELRAP